MAQSFDNLNAAFGIGLIIFIASLTGQVGFQIVAVRSIWAFARDGALPFSNFFSKIDERSVMPARANILIGTRVSPDLEFAGVANLTQSFIYSCHHHCSRCSICRIGNRFQRPRRFVRSHVHHLLRLRDWRPPLHRS